MRVFLAGASGVIGRRLCRLLLDAGHEVTGTTRSQTKAEALRTLGVTPAVLDMFDARAVMAAVLAARPDVVIHQLTDLPATGDGDMSDSLVRNARLRREATPILMLAAKAAGAARAVVQSICFVYAPGSAPHHEDDPLDTSPVRKTTIEGVRALEHAALSTEGVDGVVLRYGALYGPGTWSETPNSPAPLHVDAAAHAALLAVTRGAPGLYNIAEDNGVVSSVKAVRDLGFDPAFRIGN